MSQNVKETIEIFRLLIDVMQANPEMTMAHILIALDLDKVDAKTSNKKVKKEMLKNIDQFNLLNKNELDV